MCPDVVLVWNQMLFPFAFSVKKNHSAKVAPLGNWGAYDRPRHMLKDNLTGVTPGLHETMLACPTVHQSNTGEIT